MSSKKFPRTKLAITGGIGSGKSYVCRLIEQAGHPVFYCDDEARRLIVSHPLIRRELTQLVGPGVYAADGSLVKPVLGAYLCRGREAAARVDAIVHPRVAEAFRAWAEARAGQRAFMECALLFESGFDRLVDETILVTAPLELRLQRVMQRDGVTRAKALQWMALQWSDEQRLARADRVICNDGVADLAAQVADLLRG